MAEWVTIPGDDGTSRAVRASFRLAGVDDWTSPPGQSPDSFGVLHNVITGTNTDIKRRWGTKLFANPTMTPRRMFEAHYTNERNRFILTAGDGTGVASSNNNIRVINENGTLVTSPANVFTPSADAKHPHATTSRDYTYFSDGISVDLLKWDSNDDPTTNTAEDGPSVSKWGIDTPVPAGTNGAMDAAASAEGSGNIYLVEGRSYTVAFLRQKYDATVGEFLPFHVTDIAPFTGRIGVTSDPTNPATGVQVTLTNIPVSSDPQVNARLILATADGGAFDTLYEVTIIPDNVTDTFVDNLDEAALTSGNIWAELGPDGEQRGLIGNTPPSASCPNATITCAHRGRIYFLQEHFLFWSKHISEMSTSTNQIAGRWEEAVPIENQRALSATGAERGRGLISDGVNLYIGTNRSVMILRGDNPGLSDIEPWFHEVGVMNQEVWKVLYHEGQAIGTAWLTPDKRVIWSNFSEYHEIGNDLDNNTSIQTALNALGDITDTAHATFAADQEAEFYLLSPGAPSLTIFAYNCRTKRWMGSWFSSYGSDPIYAMAYMYDSVNRRTLPVFATAFDRIFRWDKSTAYDYADNNGGAAILPSPVIQTNWLDFGDVAGTKFVNTIEVQTTEPSMTLSLEGAIRPDEDVTTLGSMDLVSTVDGTLRASATGLQTKYRFYRIALESLDDTTETDLISYMAVEYGPINHP